MEDIAFLEQYALSGDRAKTINQLVPDTQDHALYKGLLYQLQTEEKDTKVDAKEARAFFDSLRTGNHRYAQKIRDLVLRYDLLRYQDAKEDEKETILKSIQYELGLNYNHVKKPSIQEKPQVSYPTSLDEKLVDLTAVLESNLKERLNSSSGVDGFTQVAYEWLAKQTLNETFLQQFLHRLQHPSVPNLPKLLSQQMDFEKTRNKTATASFGGYNIHNYLTQAQLQELGELQPTLKTNENYIAALIKKLQPAEPLDQLDIKEVQTYYQTLWKFVSTLDPIFNHIRALTLYHSLKYDSDHGVFDFAKFKTYLELPWNSSPHTNRFQNPGQTVYWSRLSSSVGNISAPYQDRELIATYLRHWYEDEKHDTTTEWDPFLENTWNAEILATTKISKESQDLSSESRKNWFAVLGTDKTVALKSRVELSFLPTNKKHFEAAAEVTLDIQVKNIPRLVVQVFKVNTKAFYKANQREVDSAINVDGLTPHEESVEDYSKFGDFIAIKRTLKFPSLKEKKGTFLIEVLGNGQRARAVIRKGHITHLESPAPQGHVFRLFDESGKPIHGSISFGGQSWASEEKTGLIVIPYGNYGYTPIILTNAEGDLSSMGQFTRQSENYSLTAGLYVDRESLLQKCEAELVIRPILYLNGFPVPLDNIKKTTLKVDSTNADGVSTSAVVEDLKLIHTKEVIHTFSVPDDLRRISFTLTVEVKIKSTGGTQTLSAVEAYNINDIDNTNRIEDLHLRYDSSGYSIYCLGKAGEARQFRPLHITFQHQYVTKEITVVLQTNDNGRVFLGHLPLITNISATVLNTDINQNWPLLVAQRSKTRSTIHGIEGEDIVIPYNGSDSKICVSEFALLERRHGYYQTDLTTSNLKLVRNDQNSSLVVHGLTKGSYFLFFKKDGQGIELRVAKGTKVLENYVMEKQEFVQLINPRSTTLQIVKAEIEGKDKKRSLRVQLSNISQNTRVHILNSHFVPQWDLFGYLSRGGLPHPRVVTISRLACEYTGQKNLSDLQQYIIDRKQAKKYVGNMLPRPSLLLNQKVKQDTQFDADPTERAGESFSPSLMAAAAPMSRMAYASSSSSINSYDARRDRSSATYQRNLEFLNNPSVRLLNLSPNDHGVVEVPLEQLGEGTHLTVVAVDGLTDVVTTRLGLDRPEAKLGELLLDPAYRDVRLMPALNGDKHFTEQHLISVLHSGKQKSIDDIKTAVVETYETLGDVYALYRTLSTGSEANGLLDKFAFVLQWPTLSEEEKKDKYSEFSCHELNFFIYNKDREFFNTVIKPFLQDKLQKTFLDLWFLGANLAEFAHPLEFSRLNTLEQILLGQRIGEAGKEIGKALVDNFKTQIHNPERFISLFKTALQSRALDSRDKPSTIPKAERKRAPKAEEEREKADLRMKKPASAKKMELFARTSSKQSSESAMDLDFAADPYASLSLGGLPAQAIRRTFQSPPTTKEYEERNYYNITNDPSQFTNLISLNGFWTDYAIHTLLPELQETKDVKSFLSSHLMQVYDDETFTALFAALAVLDLPFKGEKHKVETDRATKFLFTAASNVILFHKEIKESKVIPSSVAVSQNYFDPADPTEQQGEEKVDKYIQDEFLPSRVYGCRTVVTNVSSTHQNLEILQQIPEGAMPLGYQNKRGVSTVTTFKPVAPYSTQLIEYFFYFPALGRYRHYPVHVSKLHQVVGHGLPANVRVVRTPTVAPERNWRYISQEGTADEVLTYLQKENLFKSDVNLSDIAFRCKDKAFFERATSILRNRFIYNDLLWSYGLLHQVPQAISEYLPRTSILNRVGDYFVSPLLTKDSYKTQFFNYQHLEYSPLINSRAHTLRAAGTGSAGGQSLPTAQIQNLQFRAQYKKFLTYLAYRVSSLDKASPALLLSATYYLLLQDRIDEAVALFQKVSKAKVIDEGKSSGLAREAELQYDYMSAYLDFYSEKGPVHAPSIVKKYKNYPVSKKRKLFEEIERQLIEASPGEPLDYKTGLDESQRDREMNNLAATEPTLAFTVESNKILLSYANLPSVVVNFYVMDIELLFSTTPFLSSEEAKFLFVAPNHSLHLNLKKDQKNETIEFPDKFKNANVYIEIVAEGHGLSKVKSYYSNSLNVHTIESFGQVKVLQRPSNKPVPRAYVKVYCQPNNGGSVDFYKDGYTDLRGVFDYASLSTDKLKSVSKFSILVLTEEFGAFVTEARPPVQ